MAVKDQKKYIETRGGRKTSTARVRIYEGKGMSTINEKPVDKYFPDIAQQEELYRPLVVSGVKSKIHFTALVHGGGRITGHLDAVKLGLARAIVERDATSRVELRKAGLLTRDPRAKERKKYFFRKARKRPQFSKR